MSRKKNRPIVKATAYDKRGRILSVAFNSYTKTHPLQKSFCFRAGMGTKRPFLHAELAALLKAGDHKVHTLFVERYYRDGTPALSRPCGGCALAIKEFGVKHVIHT
jgi:deoxycytidylate deaminase